MSSSVQLSKSSSLYVETIASWEAYPGAYLVVGRSSVPFPKAGSARASGATSGLGVFRGEAWELEGEDYGFVLVIRLPPLNARAYSGQIVLRGSRASDREFRIETGLQSSDRQLGAKLAELSGSSKVKITHFLIEVMTFGETQEHRKLEVFIAAYLSQAAEIDGCIELVLVMNKGEAILQGWGTRLPKSVSAFIPGGLEPLQNVEIVDFERSDVSLPYAGCVFRVDFSPERFSSTPFIVYLVSEDRLFARQAVASQFLQGDDALGQLRHLMPKLEPSASLYGKLKDLLRPTYQGFETLSSSGKPVRAAVDLAISETSGSIYLSGWILDHEKWVSNLQICVGKQSVSIRDQLVLVEREDVGEAFKHELPSNMAGLKLCGFSISVELEGRRDVEPYLAFSFRDEEMAFLPLNILDINRPEVLDLALRSVDLHKSSGSDVVEGALGPFLKSWMKSFHIQSARGVSTECSNKAAIVIPLYDNNLPRGFLSTLLHDRFGEEESFVFVCGSDWSLENRVQLRELIDFYDINAEIRPTDFSVAPIFKLLEIVREIGASKTIIVSSQVSQLNYKTRKKLFDELDEADFVCPTVFFEDGTVRYAGSTKVSGLRRSPFLRVRSASSGLALENFSQISHATMTGGSLACCGFRLDAVSLLCRQPAHLTKSLGETALFMKAHDLALVGKWDGATIIVAPEADLNEAPIRQIVDSWMIRHELEAI